MRDIHKAIEDIRAVLSARIPSKADQALMLAAFQSFGSNGEDCPFSRYLSEHLARFTWDVVEFLAFCFRKHEGEMSLLVGSNDQKQLLIKLVRVCGLSPKQMRQVVDAAWDTGIKCPFCEYGVNAQEACACDACWGLGRLPKPIKRVPSDHCHRCDGTGTTGAVRDNALVSFECEDCGGSGRVTPPPTRSQMFRVYENAMMRATHMPAGTSPESLSRHRGERLAQALYDGDLTHDALNEFLGHDGLALFHRSDGSYYVSHMP